MNWMVEYFDILQPNPAPCIFLTQRTNFPTVHALNINACVNIHAKKFTIQFTSGVLIHMFRKSVFHGNLDAKQGFQWKWIQCNVSITICHGS